MWDRNPLRTAARAAPEILPGNRPRPQPHNKHQQHLAHIETDTVAAQYWQSDFDSRINALGITNKPYRYEIRRGKAVPQPVPVPVPVPGQISPPPDLDEDALPFREPPPRNPRRLRPQQQKDPAWRPASSIYPDDDIDHGREESNHRGLSPATAHLKVAARDMYGRPALEQISPPSSPDVSAVRHAHMAEDVSPIDEDMDMSQQELIRGPRQTQPTPPPQQQYRSNIPTMRRERRRQNQDVALAGRDAKPRHKMSRERLQHPVQRPDSRADTNTWEAPSDAPFAGVRSSTPDEPPLGLTTTITGPQVHRSTNNASPSFGQRVRQLGRPKPEPLDSRPAWNGASGRAPLVQPVRDAPSVAPLNVPAKSNKRGGRKISAPFTSTLSPISTSGSETSGGVASGVRKLLPSKTEQRPNPTIKTPSPPITVSPAGAPGAQSYPSPPHDESPIHASHAPSEPTRLSPVPLLTPETVPSSSKAIKRKPPPPAHASTAAHAPHPSTSSSIYSSYPEQHAPASSPLVGRKSPRDPPAANDGWVQPGSRFSITTYATSNADSPRQSLDEDRPPMPTPPAQLASVMDRRRPVPTGDSSPASPNDPIVISMKSSYVSGLERQNAQPSHVRNPGSIDSTNPRASIMSTSKALPPAPPELESVNDRVAHLNARLENLAHRKANINKSIKQMTQLMPTDNLMASAEVLRKREIEKQKVEGLKEELSEVQQEEYDLGLKLHRAYKRLEKESQFEPTTLWVRRVTG